MWLQIKGSDEASKVFYGLSLIFLGDISIISPNLKPQAFCSSLLNVKPMLDPIFFSSFLILRGIMWYY